MERQRRQEAEFIEKLDREITFEKMRHTLLQENETSISYDSKLYDPNCTSYAQIVHARLHDIFGSDIIPLQSPECSQEWLRIYKNW